MTPDNKLPARPDGIAITYINASVERVWRAFTDPNDQATYFGGKTEIGETGERWIRHATDTSPALTGTVLAREAPSRLLLTWGVAGDSPPDRIEFLIEPASNGTTRVTIREFHGRAWPEDHHGVAAQGWAALLAGLKTLVETGKPLPSPF